MSPSPTAPSRGLRRSVSLPLLVLYGLGTTIGAGVYALTGEVALRSGTLAPFSFVLAALLAAFTGLSFAELSSRHPRSAGEAEYVRQAFGRSGPALTVGLLVALAGCVSAATIASGFAGYLAQLVELPSGVSILGLVVVLAATAAWGIKESLRVAAAVTLIEVAGLLLVVWVGRSELAELPARLSEFVPGPGTDWVGVVGAATLAFFAFLGFEDMVNVAEEVRDVRRALPAAIVVTLIVTTVLYALLSTTAVLVVPPAELGESEAPLALVWQRATGGSPAVMGAIGVLAMVNGALIQIIMASRVLYGLADRGLLPGGLGAVHPRTRTPMRATIGVGGLVSFLALLLPLAQLAEASSLVALCVFTACNASLLRMKWKAEPHEGRLSVPVWVPAIGALSSAGLVALEIARLALG